VDATISNVFHDRGRDRSGRVRRSVLHVLDLETRSSRRYDAGMRQPQLAAFAPDGRVLYVTGMHGEAALYMVTRIDLATGTTTTVTASARAWFYQPTVGPDGSLALAVRALPLTPCRAGGRPV
jgi:hypothetical protein